MHLFRLTLLGAPKLTNLELILPHPMGRKVADKIRIQLIEADVEIGFSLIDEANAYRASGHSDFSLRVLRNAEDIVADIELRLRRLGEAESGPFHPLLTELRNELAAAGRKAC